MRRRVARGRLSGRRAGAGPALASGAGIRRDGPRRHADANEEDGVAEGDELAARIEQAAVTVEGIERQADPDGVRYSVDGVLFAVVAAGRASFRLRPDVAEAALATPDVHAASLGPGWVELRPAGPDQFALDRASSWFTAAARYAGESPRRRTH